MVFEGHLGGILYLRGGTAHKLACGGCSHGARHADLTLTPDLGTRDRGVALDHVAEDAGRGQRPQYTYAAVVVYRGEVVEHGRQHAA